MISFQHLYANKDLTKKGISVLYDDREEQIKIRDGEVISKEQLGDFYKQDGCVATILYSEEEYSHYLPVLEDFSIKMELTPQIGEKEDCKYVYMPKNMFYKTYDYVSVLVVDESGNTKSILSAEPFIEDIYLEFPKEESGTVAVYVFQDETAAHVTDEVILNY